MRKNKNTDEKNVNAVRQGKPRYIMIGGFLGAGKTTAVGKLAKWLKERGTRVGLITNDQGRNLVDTTILRSQGFATEEIPGGCFCCRFNSLVDASKLLMQNIHPDVFIAEPVGSCTDLVATVTYPLRGLYSDKFIVAPVSVLVDPIRALRVFGLEKGNTFSEKVLYIYLKQIEEADIVVISKCDLLDAKRLVALREGIAAKFPGKEILSVSTKEGTNLEEWFNRITSAEQVARMAMQVDYQLYAEGEALLGWLNCTVDVRAQKSFNADEFLRQLAEAIQKRLKDYNAEVVHLKMTFSPNVNQTNNIATVNLVRNDIVPELSYYLKEPVMGGQLIINLRAETAPDVLGTAVRDGLTMAAEKFPTLKSTLNHLEHFRPGKPMPTHRIEKLTN